MSDKKFVKVNVKTLVPQAVGLGFSIILEDNEGKRMIMAIGEMEGFAIQLALEGKKYVRPLTHDLMKNIIEGTGFSLEKVMITELKNETYFARIILKKENKVLSIDARPSDSIALALRFKAPIYVNSDLLR